MFCPNCGTQNPDAAQTCSKCNFHLKSVAAPKFKGTMLMMNQPQRASGAPPPAGPAGGAAPRPMPGPPQAPAPLPAPPVASKLKGTMVGVAPMGGLPPAMPAPAAVATPAPAGPSGAPVPGGGPGMEAGSAYSPPFPQQGVNPLGGTVAADGGGYSPSPYGAAQGAAPPYGGHRAMSGTAAMPGVVGNPPGQFPPYGGQPYVAPPYSAQPNPFAAPGGGGGQSPLGASPNPAGSAGPGGGAGMVPHGQAPYGQAPYGQAPYGQAPLAAPVTSGQSFSAQGPTRRNALLTWLLPSAVMFAGFVISVVLGLVVSPGFFGLFGLFGLGAGVWYAFLAIQMANEVKAVTRNAEFAWWPMFVPFFGIYWAWILVPQEVSKAKQLLGVQQPTQSIVLYIFLWHFAFASDLNDMVR